MITKQHSSDNNFVLNEQRMTELAEAELLSAQKSETLNSIDGVDDRNSQSGDHLIDLSIKPRVSSSPLN